MHKNSFTSCIFTFGIPLLISGVRQKVVLSIILFACLASGLDYHSDPNEQSRKRDVLMSILTGLFCLFCSFKLLILKFLFASFALVRFKLYNIKYHETQHIKYVHIPSMLGMIIASCS